MDIMNDEKGSVCNDSQLCALYVRVNDGNISPQRGSKFYFYFAHIDFSHIAFKELVKISLGGCRTQLHIVYV